jgi:hypothetical protein
MEGEETMKLLEKYRSQTVLRVDQRTPSPEENTVSVIEGPPEGFKGETFNGLPVYRNRFGSYVELEDDGSTYSDRFIPLAEGKAVVIPSYGGWRVVDSEDLVRPEDDPMVIALSALETIAKGNGVEADVARNAINRVWRRWGK